MTFHIDAELLDDAASIEALIETCFGPNRKGRTVYQFRDGIPPVHELCFVARNEADRMLGSIRFWPVQTGDGRILPLLGPLAVLPECQGQGIGRTLITHGLGAAERMGFPAVLIVGKPDYYVPFGFDRGLADGLTLPGPVAPLTFMAMEFPGHEGCLDHYAGLVKPADNWSHPVFSHKDCLAS
ncbi:GNAT family N-acetyltransferase [Aestuariispira insulae]|uniref:Putative N-acetyltransferase YhbS n=1 Tax=Aestuariispira insulae TaxID=1461337 RepID=A0A3D9HP26_9PROT|nr:N-acetyltransferase [Aestuariispira insulae]RED51232.1 putative N-acetyltransferase YhbS [Aestuariispira insulae]